MPDLSGTINVANHTLMYFVYLINLNHCAVPSINVLNLAFQLRSTTF